MTKLAVYSMLSLLILPFIGKVPPETDYGGKKGTVTDFEFCDSAFIVSLLLFCVCYLW